jgi:hypothetical protein
MKTTVTKVLGYTAIGVGCMVLLIWVFFFRLPSSYSALPISGQVVDADTGVPLENVIVIAVWELERGFGLEGTIPSGFMMVTEVVTDEKGNYFIQGWGPLPRPRGTYLGKNAPRLIFFKEGYNFIGHANYIYRHRYDNRRKSLQNSEWDGETINLKDFEGELESYIQVLSGVSSSLNVVLEPIFGAKSCDWMKIPKTITVFEKYYIKIVDAEIRTSLIVPMDVLLKRSECNVNNKEEFMMEHSL